MKVVYDGKISSKQFTILVTLYTIGSSILFEASALATVSKQDAWLSGIIGVIVGMMTVLLYNALGKRFPRMNFAQYSEVILGKWIGKTINILFFSFAFILSALIMSNIGYFLTTVVMPETPIQFIYIIFIMLVIMGSHLGLEVLARTAEILFPWAIFFLLFLVISVSPKIKIDNIQPIFEQGLKTIVRGSLPFIGFPFLELVIFLMIYPNVKQTKKVKKAFLIGTLFGGLVLVVITIFCILVLGADMTAIKLYPTYTLAKEINIGNYIQRIEAIIAGVWFITVFVKLSVCFYVANLSLALTLNLKDYRIPTIPLGVILIVLSIIVSPNDIYTLNFNSRIWTPYASIFGFFVPLVLLGIDLLREKGKK